jgi:murein L,D-transpeptidase YcbB/YkuD
VGRALSTQTPVFAAEMRSVIFRPYWNVPQSILLHETLPALRRSPGYLRRNDMEIVAGSTVVAPTPGNLELLRRGRLQLRQRPGPANALGLIKFDFPNVHDIYMHDTPATALFSRSRRDFSHGCVRVEDPVRLAEWVLAGDPAWTRDEILAAMHGSRTFEVKLPRPVQVLMFYLTAMVRPEDGSLRFAEDIYRHDARLDQALAGR